MVRQFKSLVELFGRGYHLFEFLPGSLGVTVDELFYLLKLMDSEDAPDVFAVGACFLSEAGRDACVMLWQIMGLDPLLKMHCRDGLLGGSNQVGWLIIALSFDLIEVLREIRQLTGCFHHGLLDKKRRLYWRVSLLNKFLDSKVNQSLVQ